MRCNRRSRLPATFFTGREFSRLSAAVLMLFILAMIIASASRPSTWTWLTGDEERAAVATDPKRADAPATPAWRETVVPGPTGADDREEQEALAEELEAVSDKAALAVEEMPSYWRSLRWARSRSWADLKAHARRDVLYTQLWERPEKYRGELISLRLHLVRALEHESPENSAGFKQVCEVWGWTDESQSFPYVAVLVERPPQLKLGGKIDQEASFVGYFLKTMAYTDALGERRASPLLLGRLQCQERPAAVSQPEDATAFWQTLAAGGAVLVLIAGSWYWRRHLRRSTSDPGKNAETEAWLQTVQAEGEGLPLEEGNGHFKQPPPSRLSALFDQQEHGEDI